MLTLTERKHLSQRLAYHFDKDALHTLLFELSINLGNVAHCESLELAQLLVRHADQGGRLKQLLSLASELNNTVLDWFAPLSAEEIAESEINTVSRVMIDRSVHLHGNNTVGVLNTGEQVQLNLEQQTIHSGLTTPEERKK